MKPRFEQTPDGGAMKSDAIRSDIADTRRKMDNTLDELGERLSPRHLIDEVLDLFRSNPDRAEATRAKAGEMASRAGDAASQATRAVVDTIRQHPIPTLLIGAGIAYALYEQNREPDYDYYEDEGESGIDAATDLQSKMGSAMESAKGTLLSAKEKVQEKLQQSGSKLQDRKEDMRERASIRTQQIRAKATEYGRRVKQSAQTTYAGTRDQIRHAADQHPLSAGLACLAFGVLAGLALPTTRREDELLGGTADKIKDRVREHGQSVVEKLSNVGSAAVTGAKQEAERQGLSGEGLKNEARQAMSHPEAETTQQP